MYQRFLLFSLLLVFTFSTAQKSVVYTHELKDFDQALSLYNECQYLSAQIIFDKVKQENITSEINSNCSFYSAVCAIHLSQSNAAVLMEQFLSDYPTSTKKNQAYIEIAHFYFESGNYPKAMQYFDKIDENSLDETQLDKFNFQKGYAFFSADKKKEAIPFFNKVLNSPTYGKQAKYYLGFMAYESDDYKKASKYFDQVADEDKYKEKLSYFQADMSFKQADFKKAIELATVALPKSNAQEKSELNKIIGESYFNLKQYDKSIPFLQEYRGKKGKWNNTDFYQLGYAFYKQNDFEKAISQFNKIIEGNDAIAQNAYYHLGESYLKTDKKQQALNAFKNASEMIFDLKIQEDAMLNYAKISYEIGNSYQSIPDVLASFIEKYPKSPSKPEVEKLLINSYLTSKNYKGALEILDKNEAIENKEVFQKVTFYRGLEFYTDANYQEAFLMFKKSAAISNDAKFTARATFWKGETAYVLNNFNESLLNFKQFISFAEAKNTPEFKNCYYNLAYSYFKLKEYEQAGNYFQNFIEVNKEDKSRLNDAYLRLGDSRFVTAKYWPALEAYNKAIELRSIDADYAQFQKAICYGFLSKNDKKIEDFMKLISSYPKSQYRDDALFELANTYVTENKTDLAIKTYDQLLAEFKNGSYESKALLRQGLIYYNAENDEKALKKFKIVASEFPKSPEALEAVASARLIYVDNGKVDEYAVWIKTLSYVEVSDADLDNDTYEAAERQYLQGNDKQTISTFVQYISKFPEGIHSLKANFYLAQTYFSQALEQNAIPYYDFVVSKSRNEFTEQSLARLAEIYLKKNDFVKVIPYLKRLETEADFPQNITFSQANLMKAYYELKDYANAVVYAEKVLNNPKTEDKVKSDAQIIIARSAMNVNDEVKAKAAYLKLASIAKGELAAEAMYFDAYFKNKEGKFDLSNKVIQKLTKDYSGYKYFGAKGLIVMAKNFYALKDSFQATYILESIIKNFTTFPDIVDEASVELNKIKTEEAKTNESVTK